MVYNVVCRFGVTFIVNKNTFLKHFYINMDATMITDNPE